MKIKQKFQYLCERIFVYGLRRVLTSYSAVLANEFSRVEAASNQFKSEVITVAADHHARLLNLERLLKEKV